MLRLLLPALIPSWRFFDSIGPSPRLEFAVLKTPDNPEPEWQEFDPRPARVPLAGMLLRLFWNPHWNESLYLFSCAEKLLAEPSAPNESNLLRRIANHNQLNAAASGLEQPAFLRVRVSVLKREGGSVIRQVLFVSLPRPLRELRFGKNR